MHYMRRVAARLGGGRAKNRKQEPKQQTPQFGSYFFGSLELYLQPGKIVLRSDIERFGRQHRRQVVKLAEREHLLQQVARVAVAQRPAVLPVVFGEQVIDGLAL